MVTSTRDLARWDPFETLTPFGMTFGRIFDDMLARREDGERLLAPPTDVWEDDHAFHVSVELPGMKKDDIRIQIENGVLAISGEKCERSETPAAATKPETGKPAAGKAEPRAEGRTADRPEDGANEARPTLLRRECRFGAFHRSIALPEGVDADASTAEFRDGVLTVRLPKSEKAKARVVEIR